MLVCQAQGQGDVFARPKVKEMYARLQHETLYELSIVNGPSAHCLCLSLQLFISHFIYYLVNIK